MSTAAGRTLAITRLARVMLQSEIRHRRQLRCIALLAFVFYCDSVTRKFEAHLSDTCLMRNVAEFNVHAVVRSRHKSPRGKSIEDAESFRVQKSSASLNQCRQSLIDLARDVIVAEDRL